MISVMMMLAGVAGQPEVARPVAPPPVIMIPSSYNAPLPPLPDATEPAVRAASSQPLPQLFSTADYPLAALRYAQQGTVAFAVAIDPTGRVTACSVTQGSGSISLDRATCSIIQRRARFTPARDAVGRAVEDRFAGRVRWVLPAEPPIPFADHKLALVFTIDASGAVARCRVEASFARPDNDQRCSSMLPEARSIAAAAAKTIAITNRELVLQEGVVVSGIAETRNFGRGPGETRGMLLALLLEVDETGTIVRCAIADESMNRQRADKGCEDSLKRKFMPLDPAASDRSARQAVRYWVSYTRPID